VARSTSTPGYLYFVADFFNLLIEISIYFLSFSLPVYLLWRCSDSHPLLLTGLGIVGFLLAAIVFLLILILIKRCLIGDIKPGRFLLTSSRSYRWMAGDRLNKVMLRSPFRGLVTENAFFRHLYFRGMGMVCDSTLLMGSRAVIGEPWAVTLGTNVLIGADAALSAHKVERNVVTLEDIVVGDDVLIGSRVLVFPGVNIGNRVVVGAGSIVVRGTVIPDGETWSGNPATKVNTWGARKPESSADTAG